MRAKSAFLNVFLILTLVVTGNGMAASLPVVFASVNPRLQPELRQFALEEPDAQVRVIIQKTNKDSAVESLITTAGGKVIHDLSIINAIVAQLPAATLPRLAQSSGVHWISLDAPVSKMSENGGQTAQFRDEFSNTSFDGSNGSEGWDSPWQEIGEEDGPETGDIAVTRFLGGALQGMRLQNANKGAWRQANLSGATSASLHLSYRRKGFIDAADFVVIEASSDGNTWNEIGRLTGPATDAALQVIEYEISGYASATTAVRFVNSSSLSTQKRFYIDDIQIRYSPDMAMPPLDTNLLNNHVYLPMVSTDGDATGMGEAEQHIVTNSSTTLTTTYYLHNDPMPAQGNTASRAILPLSPTQPTPTTLYNYDTNRDAFAGLLIAKGATSVNESDPTKVQRWRLAASSNSQQLAGKTTLTLYAAMKDFERAKKGMVKVYLMDRYGSQSTNIISKSVTKTSWNSGWNKLTFDFGILNYVLPANHHLELVATVESNADDDMWFAYGTTGYMSRLSMATGCTSCIDTTNLANTYVRSIGADQLWNGAGYIQGQGLAVAVVDSGIAQHDDFRNGNGQSRIIAQVDFTGGQGLIDDYYGHGTHVAGIIGGNGKKSNGQYTGIAPKINLVDVKVTDDFGVGSTSNVIAGLQWILNNKALYNIKVANLSLNSSVAESYHTSPLNAALEILWFNKIVVVVSAGNNGNGANSGILYPPANDPFVISVGAVDTKGTSSILDDLLALFSATGVTQDGFSKPDLIVPGVNIISLHASDDDNLAINHPTHLVVGANGNYYFRMSGTSMASAVAAGAVALLLQDEPTLSPDQVKYRLNSTATPFLGSKYLNIHAAVHGNTTQNANTGIQASQLLWSGSDPITWSSVNWNSVNWNSVNWNSVNWNSVNWNSVNWNSVNWEN